MIFFPYNILKYVKNRKEPEPAFKPEPQLVISAPALGGNLISDPWLLLHLSLHTVAEENAWNYNKIRAIQ